MKTSKIILFSIVGLAFGCGASSESVPVEKIIGAYTVESTFEVPDIKSPDGKMLGTGKVRDTIYIAEKQNGFEVSNKRWRSNSYDKEGWKILWPGDNDGALSTYGATYDPMDPPTGRKSNQVY